MYVEDAPPIFCDMIYNVKLSFEQAVRIQKLVSCSVSESQRGVKWSRQNTRHHYGLWSWLQEREEIGTAFVSYSL